MKKLLLAIAVGAAVLSSCKKETKEPAKESVADFSVLSVDVEDEEGADLIGNWSNNSFEISFDYESSSIQTGYRKAVLNHIESYWKINSNGNLEIGTDDYHYELSENLEELTLTPTSGGDSFTLVKFI